LRRIYLSSGNRKGNQQLITPLYNLPLAQYLVLGPVKYQRLGHNLVHLFGVQVMPKPNNLFVIIEPYLKLISCISFDLRRYVV